MRTSHNLITPEDLDAMLEHWARWASRDRSDVGWARQSVMAAAIGRLRAQDLNRGQVARRYRTVTTENDGEAVTIREKYEPWIAPANETRSHKPQSGDYDALAEAVDAAIQAARALHNRPARGVQAGYGDMLLSVLKMHYGVKDETTPRLTSKRAIALHLGVGEDTVARRLATMRQTISDHLAT